MNIRKPGIALLAVVALFLSSCGQQTETSGEQPESQPQSSPATDSQSQPQSDTPVSQEGADQPVDGQVDTEDGDAGEPQEPDAEAAHWDAPDLEVPPVTSADGPDLIFHEMRVGEHDGYYRVVAEFTGTGEPGWTVRFPQVPTEIGRGEPLTVAGNYFLDLSIEGTTIPMTDADYEDYYSGPKTLSVGPVEVIEDGTFEGITHLVIGMDEMRDIRIERLEDPARVVVDLGR